LDPQNSVVIHGSNYFVFFAHIVVIIEGIMGDFVRKSGGFLKGYFFWTLQFFRNDFFSFVAYVHFLPVLHTYLRFFFLAKYFLIQLHREIKRDLFLNSSK